PATGEEIGLAVDRRGAVAALPQRAGAPVGRVDVPDVAPPERLHHARHAVGRCRRQRREANERVPLIDEKPMCMLARLCRSAMSACYLMPHRWVHHLISLVYCALERVTRVRRLDDAVKQAGEDKAA